MKPHNRALPDKAANNSSSSKEKVLDSPKTILKNPQKLSQNQESCAAQNTTKTTKNKNKNILWKEPESTNF
jgi:hypothetical protein